MQNNNVDEHGTERCFLMQCNKCKWQKRTSGNKEDLKDIVEIISSCKSCGKFREFRCPNCSNKVQMKRIIKKK